MTKVGYIRVNSREQNLDRQLKALENVSEVFSDKANGRSVERPQLQTILNYIREGDIVVAAELDRLGRNNKELTELMNQIQIRGATLEILNLPSVNGIEGENLRRLINNLVIELYKYQAESERRRIKERQVQGVEIAKKEGEFKGRQLKFKENNPRLQHTFNLFLNDLSDREVEGQTGINRRTLRRYRSGYNVTVDQKKNDGRRDS